MQTSPKFLRMIISDSSLPTPLPVLRGNVTCNFMTCWSLCYWSKTKLDSRLFSYRNHLYGHMYFVREFLCSHFKLCCAPGLLGLIVAWNSFLKLYCFKYADNESPGIRLSKSDPGSQNHWALGFHSHLFQGLYPSLSPEGVPHKSESLCLRVEIKISFVYL